MDTRAISRMIADTLSNGGGTYDRETLANVAGDFYALSIHPECERVIVGALIDVADVADAIASIPADCHIGTWIDADSLYIDASTLIDRASTTLQNVLALAREHGQLAIYDMARGIEIRA